MKSTRQLLARRLSTLPHKTSTPWRWQLRLLHFGPLLIFLSSSGGQAWGNIHTWNGAGFDNYWTNAANWNGEAPVAGDDLVFWGDFFAGSENNTNNFPDGTAFRSITFQVGTTNFVLNGNRIVFSDPTHETALSSFSSGSNTIKLDIELGVNQTFETTDVGPLVVDGNINFNGHNLTNYTAAEIYLGGTISGAGDLIKTGTGRLLLDGFFNNTYDGVTRVVAGTLELNDTGSATAMIPGDVVISPGATLRLGENSQIANTANVTVEGTVSGATAINGLLDLNGFSEVIASLTLSGGGDVATDAGTLSVWGDITASASGTLLRGNPATISGNLSLGSSMRTFEVADNAFVMYDLRVEAVVSGSGAAGITKTGAGTMTLEGANTYPGLTRLSSGRLHVANATCFGASTVGTVLDGGQLVMTGPVVANESLTNVSASSIFEAGGTVTSTWGSNIVLNANLEIYVTTNSTLNLAGSITGVGGITKRDSGTLIFSGASANLYAGDTTVNEGLLELNKSGSANAIRAGWLTIGDGGGGANADVVRYTGSGTTQIHTSVPITINSSGLLDLNGHNDDVGALTLSSGHVTTGSGTLTLAGNVASLATGTSTIDGHLSLGGTRIFNLPSGGNLQVNASVAGTGGITKTNSGFLILASSNTFSGVVTLHPGYVLAQDDHSLGATSGGTVLEGGILRLSGALVDGEPLQANGGSLQSTSLSNWWSGPVTLNEDLTVDLPNVGTTLNLSADIGGSAGIAKSGPGTLMLSGSGANTYAGTTRVNAGTLVLYKTAHVTSVPGNLVIGDGSGSDVVLLGSNNQIANTADVFIQSGALLDCGTRYALIDTLHGTGTVNFGIGSDLIVGVNNGTSTFDGPMTGIGNSAGWTLAKYGTGTFTMNGDISFPDGFIHVYEGKWVANGSTGRAVTVDSGATLSGTGTVGETTGNGAISPGTSAGRLNSGSVTFGSAGSLAIELDGITAGSLYDQLNTVGTVNLTGAALSPLTVSFLPTEGSQFTIVNNDGADAVAGTFDGLAEGAVVSDSTGNFSFLVSYTGGSGNDVVLIMTNRSLIAGSAVVWSGNGNAAIETNECNLLSLALDNISASTMSGLSATLQSLTPGVVVVQPYSSYPDIPSGAARTNDAFFQISTGPGFACGATINLELQVVTTTHGTLKVPFSLPSGVAGSVARYDDDVPGAIPDAGFMEKAFTVGGIATPLKKVVVSLFISHPNAGDLDMLLIGPDGTKVSLSSDNGGSGDNYGSACDDRNRTTFDSTAAISITDVTAPFEGRFRPEDSLAAFNEKSGSDVNGTWKLRIIDDAAGNAGTINCCSLLLYPTACAPGSGICELCPDMTLNGSLGAASPQQTGRLVRNGVVATCAASKNCPGLQDALARSYNAHTFRNGPSDACITVSLTGLGDDVFSAAYLGGFDPTSLCTYYLADYGSSTGSGSTPRVYSFNVAANQVFVVTVNEVAPGVGGEYLLSVTGGNCRPVLNITRAGPSNVELDWTTAAPGYHLEGTNQLNGVPWVMIPPNPPVVVNSKFTVTNAMDSIQFYRLHKP